jgi:hypothetical protein
MDLQILYNNPKVEKRKEKSMKVKRRKKNPVNIYRKAKRDLGPSGKPNKPMKGPGVKFGKVNFPSEKERTDYQTFVLDRISEIDKNVKDDNKKGKLIDKIKKRQTLYRKALAARLKRLKAEEDKMKEKGYILDQGLTKKEAVAKLREESKAISRAKKADADLDKKIKKMLSNEKVKSSKVLGKKASKKKKAKKKSTKRRGKALKGKSSYKRKKNPGIKVLDNPMAIEVLDNPRRKKKGSKKKSSKKVSKKKSSKRKSSKKKSTKKVSKKKSSKKVSKKKSSKRKGSKKKSSKRKGSKKKSAMALEQAPSSKKSHKKKSRRKGKRKAIKASSYKKGKHKRKSNPERGAGMASKFEQITKHEVMEASGLALGGVAIKLYNQHAKSFVVNLPGIKNIYQMIPAKAAPAFDGLIDVLLAAAVGHGISYASKGNAKAESISKGLIGAAVVSFAMKATQSAYAVAGKQMNGFVAVPSMDGIIAVPEMNGIIAVPEMQGLGEADFGSFAGDGDFGAIIASPEMEGLGEADFGEADFGEFDYQDEGADF